MTAGEEVNDWRSFVAETLIRTGLSDLLLEEWEMDQTIWRSFDLESLLDELCMEDVDVVDDVEDGKDDEEECDGRRTAVFGRRWRLVEDVEWRRELTYVDPDEEMWPTALWVKREYGWKGENGGTVGREERDLVRGCQEGRWRLFGDEEGREEPTTAVIEDGQTVEDGRRYTEEEEDLDIEPLLGRSEQGLCAARRSDSWRFGWQ